MPRPRQTDDFYFEGFENPNTTPVPDVVFDRLLTRLSEAELRVLLYIIRRTFGFKRDRDAISLSQMVDGITTRDGRVLDEGTGMSRRGVMKGCAGLVEKGIITVEKRLSEQGDNEINIYSLRFKGENTEITGVGNDVPYRRERRALGVGNEGYPQQTGEQQTGEQETDSSNIRKASISDFLGEERSARPAAGVDAPPGRRHSLSDAPRGVEPIGAALQRRPGRPTNEEREVRQVVQRYISDYAAELGDTAPIKSSTTRALRLMQEAEVSLAVFIGTLHDAKKITQQRTASIQATAPPGANGFARKTKMAYFFSVLEDQLGLKEPTEAAGRGD